MKFDWTEDELAMHARIIKKYQNEMQRLANRTNKDLADKIWLQQEALRSLVRFPKLFEAANLVDDSECPPDRPMATLYQTPPIKGFNINDYMKKGGELGDDDDGSNTGAIA